MRTHIKTIHNEEYSDSSKTIGVLLNFSSEIENMDWKDSFIFIYRPDASGEGMYIFFNTIIDMNDYLLYGDGRVKRAYMPESEFDEYYDVEFIDGEFANKLTWM